MAQLIRKTSVLLVAALIVASALALVQSSPARASGACSTWWSYTGGSVSYGGCKGAVNNTWFRVGQKCGWMQVVTYSGWTRVDRGQTKTVATSPCPWYSQGARASWVEW